MGVSRSLALLVNILNLFLQALGQLQAAGLDKEAAVILNNLAATCLQTGRFSAALHYCGRALTASSRTLTPNTITTPIQWRYHIST